MNCSKEFEVYPSRLKNGVVVKTCSTKCKFEYMKKEETDNRKLVKCDHCGKEYLLYNYRNEKTINNFCSYKCQGLSKSKSIEKTCEVCSKTFLSKQSSQTNARFCSMECRKISGSYRGKKLNGRYYDTNKWKRLRTLCMIRDKNKCQVCGVVSEKNEVHHVIPRNEGGQDILDNLICVCKSCHVKLDAKLMNL